MEEKRSLTEENVSLKRLLEAQQVGISALTVERDKLKDEVIMLMKINISLEKQVDIQKTINFNVITDSNKKEQEKAFEIQKLKAKIRNLRGD